MPANAVRGGAANDKEPFFICMAPVNKVVQPGKVFRNNCWIAAAGKEVEVKAPGYDLLVEEGGAHPEWVPFKGGATPGGAVKGGAAPDHEPFYVCRAEIAKVVQPGKMFKGNCFIPSGKEVEVKPPNFEVLVAGTGGGASTAAGAGSAGPAAPAPAAPTQGPAAPGPAAPAGGASASQPASASPSGDVTWAPAASGQKAEGVAGRFCRMHVDLGVVAGIIEGSKCVAAYRGKENTATQFDVLSGNTKGYRMVAGAHPGQVPGAISVGTMGGHKVWLCGARQPNGGYALGWVETGPCVTMLANKPQDFTANLAALAPAPGK